ncbi:hypothetical protein U9M48_021785, partial [Paspalum notatum var. saurae]
MHSPPHQSHRPPAARLTRRNAIRQSAYVARPAGPAPAQHDSICSNPTEDSCVEEGDALGATEEVAEVDEGGAGTAMPESSASRAAAVVVKRRISNWWKLELVGAGSFGRVYKAVSEDGFVFAVKEASLIGPESYAKQSASRLEQ